MTAWRNAIRHEKQKLGSFMTVCRIRFVDLLRRRGFAAALLVCLAGLSLADAQAMQRFDLRIDAGDVAAALKGLAKQTGMQILILSHDASGKQSPAITGSLTTEEALEKILSGTGLVYDKVDDRTITVRPVSERAPVRGNSSPAGSDRGAEHTSSTGFFERFRLAQASAVESDVRGSGNDASTAANEPRSPDGLDNVVVVGSRLTQQKEQPVRVRVIDRKEIERTGATTVTQALNNLNEVSTQSTTSPMQSSRGNGSVKLRGLPGGLTLVLLNGRRMAASAFPSDGNTVNLNTLPLSAVERIEVLPTGSSAVFGGDAMAGVVNIVLKREFDGIEANGRYAGANGYDERSGNMGFGWSNDRAAFSVIGSYQENSRLHSSDRAITENTDYSGIGGHVYSAPYARLANVYSVDGSNLPGLNSSFAAAPAGTNGVGLTTADFGAGEQNLNYRDNSAGVQRPRTRQVSALGYGSFDLTPTTQLFTEVLFSRYASREEDYAYYVAGQYGGATVGANNPYNPFGVDVALNYLFDGTGVWCYCLKEDYQRALVGSRGSIGRWKWELAATGTRADDSTDEGPFTLDEALTRLNVALADPNPATALNPFADRTWTLDEIAPYVKTIKSDLRSQLLSVDGFIRGPLYSLPSGDIEAVIGGQVDRTKLDYAYFKTFFNADRHTNSVFAEVRVPIVGPAAQGSGARVAISGAVRRDDYSDFGSRTSPQFGLEVRPAQWLFLRGAYSSAYKPPTLYQLDAPTNSYSGISISDPLRGGEVYAITLLQGGNPNLKPLTGHSKTAGFVVTPTFAPSFEFSATYWSADIDNYASLLNFDSMLENGDLFQNEIQRAAPTPADIAAGQPGRVLQLLSSTVNFGTIKAAGIDYLARWRLPTDFGEFAPSLSATNTLKYDAALVPAAPVQDRLGKANTSGYAPEWKAVANLQWTLRSLQASVTGRYVGQYNDYAPSTRKLGNFWLTDVNVRYALGDLFGNRTSMLSGTSVSLGMVNAFNKLPVYSYYFGTIGFDPSQYDIVGRLAYIQLSAKF